MSMQEIDAGCTLTSAWKTAGQSLADSKAAGRKQRFRKTAGQALCATWLHTVLTCVNAILRRVQNEVMRIDDAMRPRMEKYRSKTAGRSRIATT